MQQEPNAMAFVPLLIMTLPAVILSFRIAGRKGKSPTLFGLLSLIPLINVFIVFYLISLTDKVVLENLDIIINKLDKLRE